MRPIPEKIKRQLAEDKFMRVCIHFNRECHGRVEWEHAIIFAGKQVNELWAIVPVCTYHHRGGGLQKDYNRFWAFKRLMSSDTDYIEEQLDKYSSAAARWEQDWKYLKKKYSPL